MLDQLGPCVEQPNNSATIAAVFAGINLLLASWLANRRIKKDRDDDRRWLQNTAQHQTVRRELRYGPSADVEDDKARP